LELQRERDQVGITGTSADPGRVGQHLPRLRVATRHQLLVRGRDQQVAVLGALLLLMLKKPVGPAEPPARLREVPPTAVMERQPERAPCRPPGIAACGIQPLRALQGREAVLHVAEKIGRGRQQLQILRRQGGRLVSLRERGVGIGPRQPPGGLAASHQRTLRVHRSLASSHHLSRMSVA
jgi:hypothetical protein